MQITLPDATWTFAEWNTDVTIEAPEPFQEKPAVLRP
jgi:hypothetical protein